MLKSSKKNKLCFILAAGGAIVMTTGSGCGKKDSAATGTSVAASVSSNGIGSLPSASSMTQSNTSSSAYYELGVSDPSQNFAVSGTPPNLTDLSANNVDQYFFGGLVAQINSAGSATAAQAQKFWGGVDGGPAGNQGCYMAQSVGETFGRLLQAGNSLCYMKQIAKVASGVTVTGSAQSDIFKKLASDKVVKISVQNMQMGGGGGGAPSDFNVFIKVSGSNSTTSDYKANLWMCQGGVVNEAEVFEVKNGVYTMNSQQGGQQWGNGSMNVTAYLTIGADGKLKFDPQKDRSATASFDGNWGKYRSSVKISATNQIEQKMMNQFTWNSQSNTNKVYALAGFTGTSLKDLKFKEAGFKGSFQNGPYTSSYAGGVEFRDTFYARAAGSALETKANAVDFTSDSFYSSGIQALSVDLSAYSCSTAADVNVTMNFADAAVLAIQQSCDSDRFDNYSMCNSSAVQSAMQKSQQAGY